MSDTEDACTTVEGPRFDTAEAEERAWDFLVFTFALSVLAVVLYGIRAFGRTQGWWY